MKLLVAFYGRNQPDDSAAALVEWQRWVAESFGDATHLWATFAMKPEGLRNDKAYGIARYKAALDDQVARGNVTHLTLTSMASNPKGYIAFEWDWTATLGLADERFGPIFVVGLDVGENRGIGCGLAERCESIATPMIGSEYGFAATFPQDFMPAGYAIGLACSGADEAFVYDANAWTRFAGKECGRSIRNVFGYNILNPKHLDIDVGGQRLESWIRTSSDRGRLEPHEYGLILWTFQEGDDQAAFLHWDYPPVVAVREDLKRHRIFPWQRLPGVD